MTMSFVRTCVPSWVTGLNDFIWAPSALIPALFRLIYLDGAENPLNIIRSGRREEEEEKEKKSFPASLNHPDRT